MNNFTCPCCSKEIKDGYQGTIHEGRIYHPNCMRDSFIVTSDDNHYSKIVKENATALIGYGISKELLQELYRIEDHGTIKDIYAAAMLTDHMWIVVYISEEGTDYSACSFFDKKNLEIDILQAKSEGYQVYALYYKGILHDTKITHNVSITKSKR